MDFQLTESMKHQFYNFLTADKIIEWGNRFQEAVVSSDFQFCPFVQYLLETGVYESVDIISPERAYFWTIHEIESLSEEELDELDEVEKHGLDLPLWVSKAIHLFDEILKSRSVTGFDVVSVINRLRVEGRIEMNPVDLVIGEKYLYSPVIPGKLFDFCSLEQRREPELLIYSHESPYVPGYHLFCDSRGSGFHVCLYEYIIRDQIKPIFD